MRSHPQLPIRVATVTLDPRDGRAVILLVHEESGGVFPLWVADGEAAAVARAISGRVPASSTDAHALLAGVIRILGARVEHVEITGVLAGVVMAEVVLADGDGRTALSARPSDAVVLALSSGAPILVHKELLRQVAERVAEAEDRTSARAALATPPPLTPAERWTQLLAHLSSSRSPKNFEG